MTQRGGEGGGGPCSTMYLDMELAVDSLSILIHQFEGMTAISIHVLVTVRNATITEQEAHLMSSLRTQSDKIPEHIRILKT